MAGALLCAAGLSAFQETAPEEDPAAKLAIARGYLRVEAWDKARERLEEVLEADPENAEAPKLLVEAVTKEREQKLRQQWIAIEKADEDWRQGDYAAARTAAAEAGKELTDAKALRKVREIIAREPPFWDWAIVEKAVREGGPVAALLLAIYLTLRLARRLYSHRLTRTWRLSAVQDESGLGIGDLLQAKILELSAARPTAHVSFGLLNLQKSGAPLGLDFVLQPGTGLATALQDVDITLFQADIGAIAKLLGAVSNWFTKHAPRLEGSVKVADGENERISIVLVATDPRGAIMKARKRAVSAAGSGADAIPAVVESAATQMYHILTHPDLPPGASEAESHIQAGLRHLRQFQSSQDAEALPAALTEFATARDLPNSPPVAWLLEGVTLDLLERHDDAILRFQQVAKESAELRDVAKYNEATSMLRKYRPESLVGAEEQYRKFGVTNAQRFSPVEGLALAGRATAIAHYPIFWQQLLHQRKAADATETVAWKAADWPQILKWKQDVESYALELLALASSGTLTQQGWDAREVIQLQWAAHNAVGNAALNIQVNFLKDPLPAPVREKAAGMNLLNQAIREFQTCVELATPGVETFSNLGTALSHLGEFESAREHLRKAIDLNPRYEYAYYRLAETWDREGKTAQVLEVLRECPVPVEIPAFQALYKKYEPVWDRTHSEP